jgi:formamidopyrimidine-DNA glycosylase
MPELPEVERVAQTMRPRLVGRKLVSAWTSGKKLRKPTRLSTLGREKPRVETVERVGKHIIASLSDGRMLHIHLGMTGRVVFCKPRDSVEPHTHARIGLDDGSEMRYVDARRFGLITVENTRPADLQELGVDPLSSAFTVEGFARTLSGARRDIKAALMDQTVLAGVGNIYALEALHLAKISPKARADSLSKARVARLHDAVVKVLEKGVKNGGTSFSDYVDADGNRGDNQTTLRVYGREGEPCPVCKTLIKRIVQQGRSSFYCPKCQK